MGKLPDYTVAMRLLLFAAYAGLAAAQEIIPARPAPSDYKAHASLDGLTIAAELQGRTVPAPNAAFVLKDYVVVEIAYFAKEFVFNSGHFSLRLNGKQPLLPQTPGMVAASVRYPSWEGPRGMTAEAGVGNAGVTLGRDTTARFPGDRRVPTGPNGTVRREDARDDHAWDWVEKLAWADGPGKGPAGGLLYFPYSGNLAKLKTVELTYTAPGGQITLFLRGSAASPAKSAALTRTP